MIRRASAAAVVLATLLLPAGCGRSPAAPTAITTSTTTTATATPTPTPATTPVLVATPVSPENGAQIPADASTITLVASNASAPGESAVPQTFEVAGDSSFSSVLQTMTVPQGQAGQTSVTLPALAQGKGYYWRVRAAAGENFGKVSEPSTFVIGSVSGLLPATPLEPAEDSVQGPRPRLEFAYSLTSATVGHVIYHAEVARDAAFATTIFTVDIGQQGSSPGTYGFIASGDLPSGDIYWRLSATSQDGLASGYSAIRHFKVTGRSVSTPTLVSPASGAVTSQQPTFVIANTPHVSSYMGVKYDVQVALAPTFVREDQVSASTDEMTDATTTAVLGSSLAPGTYIWHARMSEIVVGYATDHPLISPWTETRTFVVPSSIDAAKVVGPTAGSSVHDRPTLVVTNPARSAQAGPLEYRFDVAVAKTFTPETIVTSATVPEGPSGRTAWVVPADLVPGLHYYWRATVFDSISRLASPFVPSSDFWAVAAADRLYYLDIHINTACKSLFAYNFAFYASAPEAIGAPSFTLQTLSTLGLKLGGGVNVSGTIGGKVPASFGMAPSYLAISDGAGDAATTGTAGSDGTMSGVFNGTVLEKDYDGGRSCTLGGNTWVVRPRSE